MRCEQLASYLPGYAGGDLRRDTARAVARHIASCAGCRDETERLQQVTAGLHSLSARELEPPPGLLEGVLERVGDRPSRRFVPPLVPPQLAPDLVRAVQDNREAIAQAGATALVACGAAYALWRAFKGKRRAGQVAPV